MKRYLLQALIIAILATTATASHADVTQNSLTWFDKKKISLGITSEDEINAKRFKTDFRGMCNKFLNVQQSPAAKVERYKKVLGFFVEEYFNINDGLSPDGGYFQTYSDLQVRIILSLFPTNSFQAKGITVADYGGARHVEIQIQSEAQIESFMKQRCSEASIDQSAKLYVTGKDPVEVELVRFYDAKARKQLDCYYDGICEPGLYKLDHGDDFDFFAKIINKSL